MAAGTRHLATAAGPTTAAAHWGRQLLATPEAIPVIPTETALKEAVPPTISPLMTLQDMLCAVRYYSPTGLEGMVLPGNGSSPGKPITCGPAPKPSIFHYNNLAFKRVRIPVVFHCK